MRKAFLFDMDGVLVDSEREWVTHEEKLFREFFDDATREKIGHPIGLGVRGVYERAKAAGASIDFEELARAYEVAAMDTYDRSALTEGTAQLVERLIAFGYKLGLITSSPQTWINRVVPRLSWRDRLGAIVSIGERNDLRPKPAPDSFLEALRLLDADAARSIVLEDSNPGIEAAKAAGCFVIGFRGNLVPNYVQEGADAYADTMDKVAMIVEKRAAG